MLDKLREVEMRSISLRGNSLRFSRTENED